MKRKLLALGLGVALAFTIQLKAQSFTENFDDITTLVPGGWFMQNNSTIIGLTPTWFQGNGLDVFPAYNGGINSYIGANFNSTTGNNTISNWLLTPNRTFKNGDVITFYTRKPAPAPTDYPDRLQVRMSTNGTSTNVGIGATAVGDFTTLLLEINPTLVAGGYPIVWTQYTITISGLSAPTSGRIAFRYFVTSGGPLGTNSDFIGIDNVVYTAYTCPALTVNNADGTLLDATKGIPYSGANFTQTGALGTPSFTISEGALPAGMSLSATGTLSGTPSEDGTFNFTVTVSDASGCSGSQAYTLEVNVCQIIMPDILFDIEAECSVDFEDVTLPGIGDSCGSNITLTTDESIFPITTQGTTVIIWNYTDFYGTAGTIEQNIIINDAEAPVPDMANLPDITAECEVTEGDVAAPSATDNCMDTVTVSHNATFPISAQGTTVITWTYDDGHGNTTTQTQNIVIQDTTGPVLSVQDITVSIQEDGAVIVLADDLDTGSSDECGIESISLFPSAFFCDSMGENSVLVTATDVNGNVSTATVTVTVEDPDGYCETASVGNHKNKAITLYPNPASNMLYISNAGGAAIRSVQIYSLTGQQLYNQSYSQPNDEYSIPVSQLQSGTYLVSIETASGLITKRIVKN